MKKAKINYKRLLILMITFVLVIGGLVFGFNKIVGKRKEKQEPSKVVDHLEEYGYSLDDNETSYYKELFHELKEELGKDSHDEKNYASLVAKLFCADFFNLDNKVTSSDVGGVQFVYEDYRADFVKFAKDSIYHSVQSNLYGDRKQKLPIVSSVEVVNQENISMEYLEEEDEHAYQIDLKITYKEDFGYQEDVSLILVHVRNKLEIVEMN